MPSLAQPFPFLPLAISAILAVGGLWLALGRRRRRPTGEPRCAHCDYILIGLPSNRCPECGTLIDGPGALRGQRRRSRVRTATGVLLVAASPVCSWNPVARWQQSIYWYHYRPASMLMYDLRHGSGLPPPPNNPLEPKSFWNHGWPEEQVDLARVALDELLKRDEDGKLSARYRHEIDKMALANLYSPVGAPLEHDLDVELTKRLWTRKLSIEEQARIYKNAVALTLAAQPTVIRWDPVPVDIQVVTRLPGRDTAGLRVDANYRSVRIDGAEASWSNGRWVQERYDSVIGGQSGKFQRLLSCGSLGSHRIDLDVDVDICTPGGGIIHRERRTLTSSFVVIKPPLTVKLARFVCDPPHQAGHYLSLSWLHSIIAHGPVALRDLAAAELVLRDSHGELPDSDVTLFVGQLLAFQKDITRQWSGMFGDYIEELRATHRLPNADWRRYQQLQLRFYLRARPQVREGDLLPLEVVTVARRGDSRVSPFSACQWTIEHTVVDGVPRSVSMTNWNGQDGDDVVCVPNNGPEFGHRTAIVLGGVAIGRHSLGAMLKYDPSWTERPQQMQIPTEYELGHVSFTVLPQSDDSVRAVDDPGIGQQISQCITISNLIRWDDGNLSLSIELHRPPVDVAFRVSVEAGGRERTVGEIFATKECDSNSVYDGFTIKDARQMPATGLFFHFRPAPDLARRSVALHEYWNGDLSVGPVSIGTDRYLGPKR